jgi:O-antigen/teichoic acid export membrane protein
MLLPVFMWLVNNLDRYLLDYFHSKEDVGIYSAAYSIGAKIFLLLGGGIIAYLNSSVFKQVADKSKRHLVYSGTVKRLATYLVFGIGIVVVIYFSSDLIGQVLLSKKYEDSFALIPYLALANLLVTSIFFLEQVIYALGETRFVLYHYIVGALSNIVFNLILIPKYGIYGAAYSMILSTLLQLFFLFWLFRIKLKLNHLTF